MVGTITDITNTPYYARQQMLANAQQRKRLRANASLPKQAWVGIEDAVYPAIDDTLTIVDDLRQAGLTIEEDVLNKVTEWHKQDYTAEATVSMSPETETDEGHVEYDLDGSPIPLIHSDFSLGFRETGTNNGATDAADIETLNAEGSGRVVAEAMEKLTLNGWEPTIGGDDLGGTQDGYSMYGLTNHPSIHTGNLSDWLSAPEDIRSDLKDAMARDLKDDNFRPTNAGYWVYVGEDLEDVLDDPDPEGTGDRLVRDRIENLNFVGNLRVSEYLDPDACLMFRPTADVIDLAIALEEQVVQWEDPFRDYFKTVTAFTPRVKDTMRGQCGVAYYTGGTQ
mgnify:CR=1 FL=1